MSKQQVSVEDVRPLFDAGKSVPEMAIILGCSRDLVYRRLQDAGLNRTKERIHKQSILREMWMGGKLVAEIALKIGVDKKTVEKWRRDLGLPSRKSPEDRATSLSRAAAFVQPHIVPKRVEPVQDTTTLTGRLLATKGKYDKLAALAERERLTMTQIMQRYHRARSEQQ